MPEPRSGKTPFPLRIVPPRFLDGAEYSIAQRLGWHENRPLVHVNADMRLILVLSLRNAPGDSVSYFALQVSWGRARSRRLSRRRGSPRPEHRQRIVPGAVGARCSCDCRPGGVMLTRGSPGTLFDNVPGLHTGGAWAARVELIPARDRVLLVQGMRSCPPSNRSTSRIITSRIACNAVKDAPAQSASRSGYHGPRAVMGTTQTPSGRR